LYFLNLSIGVKGLPRRKFPVKTAYVSARVPEHVMREIEKIVWSEGYADVSDYVRNLIRRDFAERGIRFEFKEEEG